jgi:hypothetical protein
MIFSSFASGFQEGGGRDLGWPKVMSGYARQAIPGQFEAGPHIGSILAYKRQKKAKFGEFSPKPPVFIKLLKTNNLIAQNDTPKAKKSFRINNCQSHRQSQNVI